MVSSCWYVLSRNTQWTNWLWSEQMLKKCCLPPGWIQNPSFCTAWHHKSPVICLSYKSTALIVTTIPSISKLTRLHKPSFTLGHEQSSLQEQESLSWRLCDSLRHTPPEVRWQAVKATLWSCPRQVCFPELAIIAWQAPSSSSFLGVVAVINQHLPQLCEALLPPLQTSTAWASPASASRWLTCVPSQLHLPGLGTVTAARDTQPVALERTAINTQNPPPPQSAFHKRHPLGA